SPVGDGPGSLTGAGRHAGAGGEARERGEDGGVLAHEEAREREGVAAAAERDARMHMPGPCEPAGADRGGVVNEYERWFGQDRVDDGASPGIGDGRGAPVVVAGDEAELGIDAGPPTADLLDHGGDEAQRGVEEVAQDKD